MQEHNDIQSSMEAIHRPLHAKKRGMMTRIAVFLSPPLTPPSDPSKQAIALSVTSFDMTDQLPPRQ